MRASHADALLAVDIGNTRIGLAVWDADGLHDASRVSRGDPTAWEEQFARAWEATRGITHRAVVLASVHPQTTPGVADALLRVTGQEALRIRDDVPLPMPLDIDDESEVGVDRVCAAAAAHERVGGACAVASFGTAITIDCVSAEGVYLGGTILPGLDMSCRALHEHTAQLPRVHPHAAAGPFGRNTLAAINSGVLYAAVGALREIVERFATTLNQWPPLLVTGGDANLIRSEADFIDAVVPDLCLMGVALAYRRAAGQA